MSKLKVAVLISGNGSNLQSLIEATKNLDYPAEISLVISNQSNAYGLTRANLAGIKSLTISHKNFSSRALYDQELSRVLRDHQIELICLAGFMRLLSADFVNEWHQKLINIHPSLLPSFKGLHAQKQALEAGVKLAGCTVHFVSSEMDQGPIIMQAAVPVEGGDTEQSLILRILQAEHQCYPQVVRLIAEGKLQLVDNLVMID